MSWMARLLASLLALVSLVFSLPVQARRGMPPTVELDGCVLPSTTACRAGSEIVEMTVDDAQRQFAVETLRFVSVPDASTGKTLTELRLRGLRASGPKALTAKLVPGERQRVRGRLRLGTGHLLLQALEPLHNGAASAP